VAAALAMKANRANTDAAVCAEDFALRHRARHNDRRGTFAQELTSSKWSV